MKHQASQDFSHKLQILSSVSQLVFKRLGLGLFFLIILSSSGSGRNQNLAKREAILINFPPTGTSSSTSAPQSPAGQIPAPLATSTSAPCLFQAEHPAAESLPDPLPPPLSQDAISNRMELPNRSEVEFSYGIGHLRPIQEYFDSGGWLPPSLAGSLWLREVVLPLYQEPATETLWGWVACGRLLQKNSDRLSHPPTSEQYSTAVVESDLQMLETIWGFHAFIVLEEHPGDWYRLQITTPTSSSDGSFWISGADLGLSPLSIMVELWPDFLIDRSLFYLLGEKVHTLHRAPSHESEVLLEIDNRVLVDDPEDSYGLEVLEFRGDWMRVRVMKPYVDCPLTEREQELNDRSESFEGWMIWRIPEQGSQIFYPPRGC